MGGIGINRARWVTASAVAGALSWSGMVLPVRASPPFSKPAAGAATSHPPHLDLRPPSARELGNFIPAASADRRSFPAASADRPSFPAASADRPSFPAASADRPSFPAASADRPSFPAASADRPSWGRPRTPGGRESNLPALGADAGEVRTMSRAESFARRVHREGLPLARLWENHSALVSVGLNAKGKPGLWLVQKTR
jgi:hypothetical protein